MELISDVAAQAYAAALCCLLLQVKSEVFHEVEEAKVRHPPAVSAPLRSHSNELCKGRGRQQQSRGMTGMPHQSLQLRAEPLVLGGAQQHSRPAAVGLESTGDVPHGCHLHCVLHNGLHTHLRLSTASRCSSAGRLSCFCLEIAYLRAVPVECSWSGHGRGPQLGA